jgi:hypothetical protein
MDSETEKGALGNRVRGSFSRFLSRSRITDPQLFQFFRALLDRNWDTVVFGGVIRDLVAGSGRHDLRDIDLVVSQASEGDLVELCAPWITRKTRFGGLHLQIGAWPIDIWRLEDTWAFRAVVKPVSLSELPKTTFLSTEAIAVSLHAKVGKQRSLYADGFFESVLSRVVRINHHDNPYPELCVVRSLVTAHRMNMAIGPDLCVYLANVGGRMTVDDLEAVQLGHYGRVRYTGTALASCIAAINEHVQRSVQSVEPYTLSQATQLLLDMTSDRPNLRYIECR